MIILNNCIDCGRVPDIKLMRRSKSWAECKCGKKVFSNAPDEWQVSKEVLADMWNRANPVEQGFEFNREYINFLAGELASNKIKVSVRDGYLLMQKPEPAFDEERCDALITECSLHSEDLTEFYRKRLEPAV